MLRPTLRTLPLALLAVLSSTRARAADAPAAPTGAPPPDAKALVTTPKGPAAEPPAAKPLDGTSATLSTGGQLASGNSRLLAMTVNGAFEMRREANGFGASLLGNYGQGAPAGEAVKPTAENLQGRVRYDRYVSDPMSLFLSMTGRHDRFQGLDFRLNLDPGVKYMILKKQTSALWAEAGYDMQYDVRRDEARVVLDANGKPIMVAPPPPAIPQQLVPEMLDKTNIDHSTRLYAGARHAFNKEVTVGGGVEYLQSVVDSTHYRFNFDALLAAQVGGGLAVGVGFGARYDHAPLPGKVDLDTSTTLSLIYSYSDIPAPKTCPCPPEPPLPPPPAVGEPASPPPLPAEGAAPPPPVNAPPDAPPAQ